MRFLVRLGNRSGFTPADRRRLSKEAHGAVLDFKADVGNLRVSTIAIEFDLLLNSEDTLQNALKALEMHIGPLLTFRELDVVAPAIADEEAVKIGLALFNEERYWESHEALESAWRNTSGEDKETLQGLILTAAALVHWQKNEKEVTLSVLKRAREKLASHEVERYGINTAALKNKLEKILRESRPEFFKLNVAS